MKCLFRQRMSNFTSLASLIMLAAMLTLFSMFIPEFFVSVSGRVFAAIWALLAITAFIAHTRVISERSYKPYVAPIEKRASQNLKSTKQRMLRGM